MNQKLDEYQEKVVKDRSKYLLVSAPAGSGKTFTILEKINYLIKNSFLKEEEIICISFTNESVNNLKQRLQTKYNYNISCYTFHKLGLEILKEDDYRICEYDLLNYTINEYLHNLIDNTKENKKRILNYLNVKYNIINYNKKYLIALKKDIYKLKKIVYTFINLFKSNDFSYKDLTTFISFEKKKKVKDLLIVITYIYTLYQEELKSRKELDFNDMITMATSKIKKDGFNKNIKLIIIDEFQDTSKVRFNLIKELINKTNSNLVVVGDDFQSIYRFTGCDLDLFLNFNKLLPNSKTLNLSYTYRNSIELITTAGLFITKNTEQIKKDLRSDKSIKNPIEIVYYHNFNKALIDTIKKVYKVNKNEILLLGRNNNDIKMLDKNLFIIDKNIVYYKNIKLVFLTIHKAKGLEYENVIIINFKNDILGFPNKIENEAVLKYVTSKEDKFPYSEERRLLYVALTRTLNKVYLLSPIFNRSVFIKELEKSKYKNIKKTLNI